jgi:hypothetical protein
LSELDPAARDALERDLPALLAAFSMHGPTPGARPDPQPVAAKR